MATIRQRLRALVARGGDRRGSVAVIVSMLAVALIGMLALALDVSNAVSAHTRLREAADVAALTAVRQAAVLTVNNVAADLTAAQSAGRQRFTAQASSTPNVTMNDVAVSVERSGLTITSTVTFNATYATQVAGILNNISPSLTSVATLPLGGRAGAKQQLGAFVDIQVLMDTSNSMTIAATPTDKTSLESLTTQWPWYVWDNGGGWPAPKINWNNCQFACHATLTQFDPGIWWLQPWAILYSGRNANYTMLTSDVWMASATDPAQFPGGARFPLGRFSDFYALAKANGVTLRIDVLKQAVTNVVQAAASSTNADKFRFGFYTFDADSRQVYPLGTAAGVGTAVSTTEVTPYPYPQSAASQTNVATSIRNFTANYTSQAGDGSAQAVAKKFVVILTDGIEDFTDGGGREYAAFDPTACDAMKAKGVGVIVLQAASLGNFISGNDPAALFAESVANMKKCASDPNYYFLASDPAEILAATQAIINLTISLPTLITQGSTSMVRN